MSVNSGPKDGGSRPGNAALVKRWEGETETASEWTGFHKDPELWIENGNCLVYLNSKGEPSRGPSFQIPFIALVEAKCFAFIERYIDKDFRREKLPRNPEEWSQINPRQPIELYIPIPRAKPRLSAGRHLLAIRNFLSWAVGGCMVGEHLGGSLVALVHSMAKYRPQSESHLQDLMTYMDDQGYLDFESRPSHALAALYLAECLRLKNLYIRAFAHCVGMREKVYTSTEYTKISLYSRKTLRKTREDFQYKLEDGTKALETLLDDELSESNLGLPRECRAHLDRFRSFLLAFYTKKLGYYPPRRFSPSTLSTMLKDFEALYDLLVDDGCEMPAPRSSANSGGGGLCMLQLLQTFDAQNRFRTLQHPLPLLPEVAAPKRQLSRRQKWLTPRGERDTGSNNKLVAHTALIKASNWREQSFKNDLVRAYREYEGQTIVSPNAADKPERVSVVDARKVRWILIYSTYQVLRSVAKRPVQVESEDAPYFLTASVGDLPPIPKHLDTTSSRPPRSFVGCQHVADGQVSPMTEIKPDVDYFALTHRDTPMQQQQQQHQHTRPMGRRMSASAVPESSHRPLSRSDSVSRMLRRSSTLRQSFRRFKPGTPTGVSEVVPPPQHAYHEIVVHGYGNGTNDVNVDDASAKGKVGAWAAKSNSIATGAPSTMMPKPQDPNLRRKSLPAESRVSYRNSNASSVATLETDKLSTPASPVTEAASECDEQQQREGSGAPEPVIVRNSSHKSLTQRYPMRTVLETIGRTSSVRRGSVGGKEPAPAPAAGMPARGPSFRKNLLPESWIFGSTRACDADIDEEGDVLTALQAETEADWVAMQAFLDHDGRQKAQMAPAWEQYTDLGGLTEMQSA